MLQRELCCIVCCFYGWMGHSPPDPPGTWEKSLSLAEIPHNTSRLHCNSVRSHYYWVCISLVLPLSSPWGGCSPPSACCCQLDHTSPPPPLPPSPPAPCWAGYHTSHCILHPLHFCRDHRGIQVGRSSTMPLLVSMQALPLPVRAASSHQDLMLLAFCFNFAAVSRQPLQVGSYRKVISE